ncbi:hypothetical protein OEG92_05470 [Polaribacter sejongensis]|uniref:hypothetical protein n=1 Tax=Polaribacter sejongensis TaxID=985043 RepID=UPI0035A5EBCF
MVGLDYVINLIDKSFSGGMKKAKESTKGLDTAVGKTNTGIGKLSGSSKQGFGSIITWAKRAAIATRTGVCHWAGIGIWKRNYAASRKV